MADMRIRGTKTEVRGVEITFTTNAYNDLVMVVDGIVYEIPRADAKQLPGIIAQWLHDHEIRSVVGDLGCEQVAGFDNV